MQRQLRLVKFTLHNNHNLQQLKSLLKNEIIILVNNITYSI